jgi:hypothetical protein
MDEARQRHGWQQTAAVVCMVYNAMVDTRKTGQLTPDKVHTLAGDQEAESETVDEDLTGTRFSAEDSRLLASVFGDRKTVYKVKR